MGSRRALTAPVRVLLRLPAALHGVLTRAARAKGLSFNEYCIRILQAPPQADETSAAHALVSDRARQLFGEAVTGLVAIGSWVRGDAARTSDIDVLVALASEVSVTRDLYREWDREPLTMEGRSIDVHFVHVPRLGTPPSAVWCEAAVDGQVWLDVHGSLRRYLSDVRRAIADGRIVPCNGPRSDVLERGGVMRNRELAFDHLRRATARLRAVDVLFDEQSWADVVRESQEIVEFALKGLLRSSGIDPPRIHDVADVLLAERALLHESLDLDRLALASRTLRRDRELAFYGAEDLTPSAFYKEADAVAARQSARDVVAMVSPHISATT